MGQAVSLVTFFGAGKKVTGAPHTSSANRPTRNRDPAKQKSNHIISPIRRPPRHILDDLGNDISEIPLDPQLLDEQRIDEPLIVIDIPRNDVQHIIHPTTRRITLDDRGSTRTPLLEPPHILRRMTRKRHLNDDATALERSRPVDIRPIALD